jgi:hypothetical protein
MPFFAYHSEISRFSDQQPKLLPRKYYGRVVEVKVLNENTKVASCQLVKHDECGSEGCFDCKFLVGKWPLQFWGKLRGLFDTRKQAEETLNKPLPRFDHDGKKI